MIEDNASWIQRCHVILCIRCSITDLTSLIAHPTSLIKYHLKKINILMHNDVATEKRDVGCRMHDVGCVMLDVRYHIMNQRCDIISWIRCDITHLRSMNIGCKMRHPTSYIAHPTSCIIHLTSRFSVAT